MAGVAALGFGLAGLSALASPALAAPAGVLHPDIPTCASGSPNVTTVTPADGSTTYTVPSGVTSLQVVAQGGQGAAQSGYGHDASGGAGAVVTTDLSVTASEALTVAAGSAASGTTAGETGGASGGAEGGAGGPGSTVDGDYDTGGGGAGSTVYDGATLLVAAGGGGGGGYSVYGGEGSGGSAAANGGSHGAGIVSSGGNGGDSGDGTDKGGTGGSSSAGAGGAGTNGGSAGSGMEGGAGGTGGAYESSGGGGGGGYAGGGGGGNGTYSGGGGAGSSYSAAAYSLTGGSGDGSVTLSWEDPAITSAAGATFTVGTNGSFTVCTTGVPTDAIVAGSGVPAWATFHDNGNGTATLSGTPPSGSGGTYPFTITASNGNGTAAMQDFTLTVDEPPTISSADHTTFTVGTPGSFAVTTSPEGYPAPPTITSGTLPAWLSLTDHGDGTATLAGTPPAGSGGVYDFSIGASNGVSPDASQPFTLYVDEPPSITSANHATFTVGLAGNFTVTTSTSEYPTPPTISEMGSLPTGVGLLDNGDGTATLFGTPAPGTAGSYPITIKATNGVSPDASQPFTLTVVEQPQTLTFLTNPPSDAVVGSTYTPKVADPAVPLADLTLGVSTTTTNDACSVTGGVVTFEHSGLCVIDVTAPQTATYLEGFALQPMAVGPAATSTSLAVGPSTLTATVKAVAPGGGTPTGDVTFSVDGTPVGTAPLSGGVATLSYAVPSGASHAVSATYAGDADYTGSSASTSRDDPVIAAHVASASPATKYGWFDGPVTVTFTCTATSAALTTPCPSPVTLSANGAGQSVSRTITAADGGAATAVVSGINIDQTKPVVTIHGVTSGHTYAHKPSFRATASDPISGIASLEVARSVSTKSGLTTVDYVVTATNKAGGVTVVRGYYRYHR